MQTQFAHPFENKLMTLTAPLPEDMKALLAKIAPRGSWNDLGLGSILLDQQTGLLKGKCAVPVTISDRYKTHLNSLTIFILSGESSSIRRRE